MRVKHVNIILIDDGKKYLIMLMKSLKDNPVLPEMAQVSYPHKMPSYTGLKSK